MRICIRNLVCPTRDIGPGQFIYRVLPGWGKQSFFLNSEPVPNEISINANPLT